MARISGSEGGGWRRRLAEADLEEELRRGRQRLRRKMDYARRLGRRLAGSGAAGDSRALGETLLGIGEFWRRYDWRFAAHEVPCDIDYPLALPVSENLRGVDYLTEWLGRLEAEVRALTVGAEERRAFALRMALLTEEETAAALRRWAEGMGEALGLPEGRDRRYLVACAGALLPRVRTAVEQGGWPGIFP